MFVRIHVNVHAMLIPKCQITIHFISLIFNFFPDWMSSLPCATFFSAYIWQSEFLSSVTKKSWKRGYARENSIPWTDEHSFSTSFFPLLVGKCVKGKQVIFLVYEKINKEMRKWRLFANESWFRAWRVYLHPRCSHGIGLEATFPWDCHCTLDHEWFV